MQLSGLCNYPICT